MRRVEKPWRGEMQDKLQLLERLKASRLNKENEVKSRLETDKGWETVQKYSKNIQTAGCNGISYDKTVQTFSETFENHAQTEHDNVLQPLQVVNDGNVSSTIVSCKTFDQLEFDQFLQQKYDLICQVLEQEAPITHVEDSDVQTWGFSKDKWLTDLCVSGDLIVASYECFNGGDDGGVILWRKGDSEVKRVLKADVI